MSKNSTTPQKSGKRAVPQVSAFKWSKDDLRFCLDWCLRRYDSHYSEQGKLIAWGGSVFVSLVVLGALFQANMAQNGIPLPFILLMHAIFLVVWLYYLHKRLLVKLYSTLADQLENALAHVANTPRIDGRPLLKVANIRDHYLGKHFTGSRFFSRVAIGITSATYLLTVTLVGFRITFNEDEISVDTKTFATVVPFIVVGAMCHWSAP